MKGEGETQVKVGVGIEVLWKALTKDFKNTSPEVIPNFIEKLEVLEGDGGSGTVYLFTFGPDVPNMSYQKERVVDFDESLHQIALDAIEGGRLTSGYMHFKNTFQCTALGDKETMVLIKVNFETADGHESRAPEELLKPAASFIKSLETFLLKQSLEC